MKIDGSEVLGRRGYLEDDVSYGSETDMVHAYLFINNPQLCPISHIHIYSHTITNIFWQVLDSKEAVLCMIEDFWCMADVLAQPINFNNVKWMMLITTSKLAMSWWISQGYNSIVQKHELYQSATWPRTLKEHNQFNYVVSLPDESSWSSHC